MGRAQIREIIENFPTLWKEAAVKIQEAKEYQKQSLQKKKTYRSQNGKTKDKLKSVKKKIQIQRKDIRITVELPFKIVQAKKSGVTYSSY